MVHTRTGGVAHQSHDGEHIKDVWSVKGKKGSKNVGSSPLKFLSDEEDTVPCKVCPKTVDNQGVKCDRCLGWVHVKCSNMSKDEYDSLSRIANDAVRFFCPPCLTQMNQGKDMTDRQAIQEAKIDTLMKTVEVLQQQNMQILKLLTQSETKMIDSTKEVQGKINESLDKVQTKMNEALLEEKEKEKRKKNAIISNISESTLKNGDERMRDDREKVADVLRQIVDIEEAEIENVVRLGSKIGKDGKPRQKPRLLKIIFKAEEKKKEVIKNARGLNEGEEDQEKRIYINNDETDAERKRGYELRQKLKAKKQETGENDWVIRNGEIVKRRPAQAARNHEDDEQIDADQAQH